MSKLTVLDHPLIDVKMTVLRDRMTPAPVFRRVVHEVAALMSHEIFSHIRTEEVIIETPLESTSGSSLPVPRPCLISILRAGNGLVDALSAIMPEAPVGHLGMQRNLETHRAEAYYEKLPPELEARQIILADPMLATGGSAIMATERLKHLGGKDIRFVALVAAPEGVAALSEAHPDIPVIAASLDRELDANSYILPGLGDAGDRIYGTL